MAAALQELSTNASKYGALSQASGRVDVTWERVGDLLRLAWRERNGPAVAPPTRQGFGTKMIEHNLARDTGWRVKLNYAFSGFECLIELQLAKSKKLLSDLSDVEASPLNESNLILQ
jgi:two-component sensor histidine kinase